MVSKQTEQLSLKLMGIPPAWFSSSRTLCQRCYIITRTKAVRKYHYHNRKVMAAALRKLLMERWQESLSGFIPPLVGYGVPAQRLSFYRNVFGCFMLR